MTGLCNRQNDNLQKNALLPNGFGDSFASTASTVCHFFSCSELNSPLDANINSKADCCKVLIIKKQIKKLFDQMTI